MPRRSSDRDPMPRAQRMYENGERRQAIAVSLEMSEAALDALIRREGWRRKRRVKPAVDGGTARREAGAPASADPGDGQSPATVQTGPEQLPRADVAAAITRAVERELAAIDAVLAKLGAGPQDAGDAERTARTLASLARALKELKALDGGRDERSEGESERDDMPRDIDEFRRELARRMDALVACGADGGVPGKPE